MLNVERPPETHVRYRFLFRTFFRADDSAGSALADAIVEDGASWFPLTV